MRRRYPKPENERARLEALRSYGILDSPPEPRFDEIAELASRIAETPIALISLIDEERQWFKARVGLEETETPRDLAFCAHAIMDSEVMIVRDATVDERFSDNPLVTGAPNIRFYAGAPLVTESGQRIGTLCTIDRVARELSSEQKRALQILSRQVMTLLEMRREINRLQLRVIDQDHTERELILIDQVTRTINEAESIEEAITSGIDAICDLTGWSLTDVWIPDGDDDKRFRRIIHRGCDQHGSDDIVTIGGAGIVGATFESERPIRLPAADEVVLPGERSHDQERAHLLAVPLGNDPRVAVIVFHLAKPPEEYDRLLNLVFAICASLGITTEKLMSRSALRVSEEQLRDLFENATDLIQSVSPDGRFLFVNDAWLDVLGYEPEHIGHLRIEDVVAQESLDQWKGITARVLDGHRVGDVELEFRTRDGSRLVVAGNVSARTEGGIPVSTRAILRNVTIRRNFERALRSSEEQLRAIVTNMLGGLVVADEMGVIRQVNPSAVRLFGFSEKELVGKRISELVPDHVADEATFLSTTFREAIGRITEWQGRRKNGALFPFELSLFEFQTTEGKFIAGNIRDISARREVDRLKSEFVATVSHELRTPLTSIRGSLGLLNSGRFGTLDEKGARMLDIAEHNSLRLLNLINDILDFEKLESGRMDFEIVPVLLGPIIRDTVESLRGYAKQHDIRLVADDTEELVRADAHRIAQVLTNFLSNAIKFSEPGQTVEISASSSGNMIEVSVTDHGRGIPEQAKPKIFSRFSQIDSGDAKEKGGTGLGLAISKAIVDHHGGSIGFDSRLGEGTRFWFRIHRDKMQSSEHP